MAKRSPRPGHKRIPPLNVDDDTFDYCLARVLVMGAGNVLLGDDGFGPAVIEELQGRKGLPKDLLLMDVGSSARGVMFNILTSEKTPETLILVDIVTRNKAKGKSPGEVMVIDIDDLPVEKSDDFQFHFVPTSSMLKDLRDQRGVEVVILACVAKDIPDQKVHMGLSAPVRAAVKVAAERVITIAKARLSAKKKK